MDDRDDDQPTDVGHVDSGHVDAVHDISDDPLDSSTVQPPHFEPARHSVLTPMGEVESMGSFARGLGAQRVKWAIAIAGGLALLLAALSALS